MTQIEPFNPQDMEIQANLKHIMLVAPVKNLTEEEVLTTLRLLQLHVQLMNPDTREVVIEKNDPRLRFLPHSDIFLAMLIDWEMRYLLLCTKDLVRKFQCTGYHWKKIAHECPIASVASAVFIDGYPGGYLGRGWRIAPHILTLIRWIVAHSDNEQIKSLTGLY